MKNDMNMQEHEVMAGKTDVEAGVMAEETDAEAGEMAGETDAEAGEMAGETDAENRTEQVLPRRYRIYDQIQDHVSLRIIDSVIIITSLLIIIALIYGILTGQRP